MLDQADPPYRGVQIPLRFWKIAAWAQTPDDSTDHDVPDDGGVDSDQGAVVLAATGYVLDQTPRLDDIDLPTARALAAGSPPLLGPFRTFQVPSLTSPRSPASTSDRWSPPTGSPLLLRSAPGS